MSRRFLQWLPSTLVQPLLLDVMLDSFTTFLRGVSRDLRFADVIDVLLVAAFLFVVISLLRRSTQSGTSRRAFVALVLVAGVYVLARFLELYLIERLVEVLLLVLLLAVVVVFQSDIRRMLDWIGSWRWTRPRLRTPATPQTVDLLAEASARMAEDHIGALIAVRGREPWERHLQGGIALQGLVSLPLLYSIFHPKTPGHDGAVLIEGGRVTRFGVHLPLATTLPEASRYGGTRHAAALGLAEHCDAFVIIVSEERGSISVAQDGQLVELASASELKRRLEPFWRRHYTTEGGASPHWWSRKNLQTAGLSLALATFLWLMFAYSPNRVTRPYTVPIEYRNLPSSWALEEPVPTDATIVLSGPEQAFRLLNTSGLAVSLDLAEPDSGRNEFALTEENLSLPSNLELLDVRPAAVTVTALRMRSVRVPVTVQTSGALPDSLELVEMRPAPDTVRLLVPGGRTDTLETVETEPIDLSTLTGSTTVSRQVIPAPGTRLATDQSAEVNIQVQIRRMP